VRALPLILMLMQAPTVALENDYVRVTRNAAPCASVSAPGCAGNRVVVALGDLELRSGGSLRKLARGDVAVFTARQSYEAPRGGPYFEVVIKPNHPPVKVAAEIIPPAKNSILYDGKEFFIFEERLPVGDTRARHSHNQRVVIQLNRTRLQQWPEGLLEVVRDIEPDLAGFNQPVIHTVKNVGDLPLRGVVIEFKAEPKRAPSK
jgi:hypothetical protein